MATAADIADKPAFTPGPWDAGGRIITVWGSDLTPIDAPEKSVAFVPSANGADARLIAAAPELYEALETFVTEYVELVESGDAGFWDAEQEGKVKAARAALAKARGEA
jgi:hypothetical protein